MALAHVVFGAIECPPEVATISGEILALCVGRIGSGLVTYVAKLKSVLYERAVRKDEGLGVHAAGHGSQQPTGDTSQVSRCVSRKRDGNGAKYKT